MRLTKKVALSGVLTALAIVLSILEQYLPIQLIIPLPGIKLGIANVVTLFALMKLDFKYAAVILILRCCVVSLLFGTPVSWIMSICGGVCALCGMWLLYKLRGWFSLFGISVAGAALHNIGQIVCAMYLMQSLYVAAYLPLLLCSSFLTGFLVAVLTLGVTRIKIIKEEL